MAGGERFVGRRDELALLGRRLADARAGQGSVILVTGPAGIGKTGLVVEFLATVDDAAVGWGGTTADEGMPPMWPWVRAVRGWAAPSAALASALAGDAAQQYGSAEEAAAATFAADTQVIDALEERARSAGALVIVLDDLHRADRPTLRLLDRLAAEAPRLPLLVIGTCREGPLLGRSGRAEELHLGPLGVEDATAFLSRAVDRPDPSAVRKAAHLSGGSPLFLRTLSRVAVAELRGQRTWDDTIGVAPEFRNLVLAAMSSAGSEAAADVGSLSVLGLEADLDLVARLIGADTVASAVERLLPAVPAGLVELRTHLPGHDGATAGSTVRFAHALVRDAAYASLPPQRRGTLHRMAAELIEPLAMGRDDRAGEVAGHWIRAGEPDRAVTWAVRAADAARAAGAYEQAASQLELALDAIDRTGSTRIDAALDRAELLLDLARVRYLGGDLGPSLRTCGSAADEGERTGRPDVVARAAITVQGIGHPDANRQIQRLCRRALAALDDTTAADLRARVASQLACTLMELGATDEAEHWTNRALTDAAASGDPNAELDAIRARVTLRWRSADDAEVHALGGRAVELADTTQRPLARLWAHAWRCDIAVRRAEMAAVRVELGELQNLADRTGLPLVRWHLLRRQASLAGLTGNFEACRRLGLQAMDLAESWQDDSMRYTHLARTVHLALLRGDPADIDPQWTDFVGNIDGMPPVAHAIIAAALLLVGRADEARLIYEELMPALGSARTIQDAAAVSFLYHLALAFDDAPGCARIRNWMAEFFEPSLAIGDGTVVYVGSLARILGQLALAAGDPVAAAEHFRAGLTVDEALGARPYVAEGRLGLARALNATGDVERAIDLARAAAAEARRLDMPALVHAAQAFLSGAAAGARAADPLTDREREVLALVAQAMSNREVAQRLVLSERTVESHVRNILAKTGLTRRSELIRWYRDRDR
jgi:DNA-binding CsgD family transcriptional regulator